MRRDSTTLHSYLFAAIDEPKGDAIESGVDVINLIVGDSFRGHEFHHSSVTDIGDATFAIRLTRGVGIKNGWGGIMVANTLAGYAHLRACSYLRFAEAFVNACL